MAKLYCYCPEENQWIPESRLGYARFEVEYWKPLEDATEQDLENDYLGHCSNEYEYFAKLDDAKKFAKKELWLD